MDRMRKSGYRTALMAVATILALASLSARHKAAAEDKPTDPSPSRSGGLFPNDSGPAEIDVSKYPKEMQTNYRLFTVKCAVCHTIARPINSQFLELSADELKKAKTDEPTLFKDTKIVQPNENIWNRYVKRMMTKPGCPVGRDGKKIWDFLIYDSKLRKMGPNAAAWQTHRRKLVEDFKKQHPDDYKNLFGNP